MYDIYSFFILINYNLVWEALINTPFHFVPHTATTNKQDMGGRMSGKTDFTFLSDSKEGRRIFIVYQIMKICKCDTHFATDIKANGKMDFCFHLVLHSCVVPLFYSQFITRHNHSSLLNNSNMYPNIYTI